jgi:hypothetical protein
MNLEELRLDCAVKQKKGLHFILASVVIWAVVAGIHATDLPILSKNFYTFCATAPLVPLAFLISKVIGVEFSDRKNPLNNLGLLFSFNQLLYLLIAMWVYPTVPLRMVMVIGMIFGAHLLPYGWLYKSRSYMVMAVVIPLFSLFVGMGLSGFVYALVMVAIEVVFSLLLFVEVRRLLVEES